MLSSDKKEILKHGPELGGGARSPRLLWRPQTTAPRSNTDQIGEPDPAWGGGASASLPAARDGEGSQSGTYKGLWSPAGENFSPRGSRSPTVYSFFTRTRKGGAAEKRPLCSQERKLSQPLSGGSLGLPVDEERSKMRYLMRIAGHIDHRHLERTWRPRVFPGATSGSASANLLP